MSATDPNPNDVTIQLIGQSLTAETGQLAANKRTRVGKRRGKPVRDVLEGQTYSKGGALVNILRVIDRDANFYKEHVQDARTGDLLRDAEEPLSEHQGHGDAKPDRRK